mmetsp:Transcript_115850/g.181065  ORF Transcript_115850/g.181065 Transcript_115850/m.181065 type:complete len:473 (-) Transcript_115850:69-1487(-)
MSCSRGGRTNASLSKVRRVTEDEVLSRWDALRPNQRQAATRFEDAVLISRIRDAIQELFQQQTLMQRMGIDLGGPLDPSIFTTSALFTEVFDLPWKIHKSEEFPDAVLMDPDDQPSLMTLRHQFSEGATGEQLVARFRLNLSDFLAHTGRTPMPKARWKELFTSRPSSVSSLEEQLAKLFEQALWAMAMDPCFEVENATKATDLAEDALSEDWMDELETADAKRKKKKKKRKKVAAAVAEEDLAIDQGDDHPTDNSAECPEEALASPESEALPNSEPSSPILQKEQSQPHPVNRASVLQEHYWGRRESMMSELLNFIGRRRTQQAVETELDSRGQENAGLLPPLQSELLTSRPIEHRSPSDEWKPSQPVRYIWSQTCQIEHDSLVKEGTTADTETSSTSIGASSTSLSSMRGFWATPNGDASPIGACILERNTFLELHTPKESAPALRPRSLSPTYMKAVDIASLSTNYWHR